MRSKDLLGLGGPCKWAAPEPRMEVITHGCRTCSAFSFSTCSRFNTCGSSMSPR